MASIFIALLCCTLCMTNSFNLIKYKEVLETYAQFSSVYIKVQ